MLKKISIFILLLINLGSFSVKNDAFGFLDFKWGSSLPVIQESVARPQFNLNQMKHYPIFPGRDLKTDLSISSYVKFQATGYPLYPDIPGEIIFTFYNSNQTSEGLALSRIEIYLNKKNNKGLFINIHSIFKNTLSLFCEKLNITLEKKDQFNIFNQNQFEFQDDQIQVNFIANIDNNRLNRGEAIYISHSSVNLQKKIAFKEIKMQNMQDKNAEPDLNQ